MFEKFDILHVIPTVLSSSLRRQGRESIYIPTPGFLITTVRNDTTPLFRKLKYYGKSDNKQSRENTGLREEMATPFPETKGPGNKKDIVRICA